MAEIRVATPDVSSGPGLEGRKEGVGKEEGVRGRVRLPARPPAGPAPWARAVRVGIAGRRLSELPGTGECRLGRPALECLAGPGSAPLLLVETSLSGQREFFLREDA